MDSAAESWIKRIDGKRTVLYAKRYHRCFPCFKNVMRVEPREVFEAEELLEEVQSWSEEEVKELPKFYREKAREFRRQDLPQPGEG